MKDKMTWEETIEHIRNKPEYQELVRDAYFDSDLVANVERFISRSEFDETLKLIRRHTKVSKGRILDIGSGNGISVLGFALKGWKVDTVEPDPSFTIGAGAIRELVNHYQLNESVNIHECFAEDVEFPTNYFDVVYARQSMHHANDLKKFVKESTKSLKLGGLFLTVRDHVIYGDDDKAWFLETHPLHKFYGGENAYTEQEYKEAMLEAGLEIEKVLKFFDSEMNYFPMNRHEVKMGFKKKFIYNLLKRSNLLKFPYIGSKLNKRWSYLERFGNEKFISGRMYTFIAIKK